MNTPVFCYITVTFLKCSCYLQIGVTRVILKSLIKASTKYISQLIKKNFKKVLAIENRFCIISIIETSQ